MFNKTLVCDKCNKARKFSARKKGTYCKNGHLVCINCNAKDGLKVWKIFNPFYLIRSTLRDLNPMHAMRGHSDLDECPMCKATGEPLSASVLKKLLKERKNS